MKVSTPKLKNLVYGPELPIQGETFFVEKQPRYELFLECNGIISMSHVPTCATHTNQVYMYHHEVLVLAKHPFKADSLTTS